MFKAGAKTDAGPGDTLIAPGVKVEGDFVSQGNIVIEGEVTGTLKTMMDLVVGTDAKITANVSARNAKISGEVRGNISIEDRLDLSGTAKISGDVQARVLVMEAGALLNGRCAMGEGVTVAVDANQETSTTAHPAMGNVLAQSRILRTSRVPR